MRRAILAAYWTVVLACLPIWWAQTSIQRLSLPETRILHQERAVQEIQSHVGIRINTNKPEVDSKQFVKKVEDVVSQCAKSDQDAWRGTNVHIFSDAYQGETSEQYDVNVHFGSDSNGHKVYGRQLDFHASSTDSDTTASDLGTVLCQLLTPTANRPADQRVTQYAPNFRLAFSLMNEDIGSDGQAGWAADKYIKSIIKPTLELLSPLHNFTIESQVQYYAPLAFEPPRYGGVGYSPYYGLGEDELKIFVNSAEWSLSSKINNDPVLHFLLFIPSKKHKPLLLHDSVTGQRLTTPAFIIPQWGGVIAFNHGHPYSPHSAAEIFAFFRTQLLALLGVPSLPTNVTLAHDNADESAPLSGWQIDALLRRRMRENTEGAGQTLRSIVSLVKKLENMPVGMDVKGDVLNALEELEAIPTATTTTDMFTHSRLALSFASRAFFNPGMLGQLYFPAEHTYAIYMLFAPASMPLIVTLIKEIRDWQKRRKAKTE